MKLPEQEWADEGRLLENNFEQMIKALRIPSNLVDPARFFYMAGAQVLFTSIVNILDPGSEPTEADLKRMDLIHNELVNWFKTIKQHHEAS